MLQTVTSSIPRNCCQCLEFIAAYWQHQFRTQRGRSCDQLTLSMGGLYQDQRSKDTNWHRGGWSLAVKKDLRVPTMPGFRISHSKRRCPIPAGVLKRHELVCISLGYSRLLKPHLPYDGVPASCLCNSISAALDKAI